MIERNAAQATDAAALAAHLLAHARRYFSAGSEVPVRVRLVSEQIRLASSLYWFKVNVGDRETTLVVKVAARRDMGATGSELPSDRPRVSSCLDSERSVVEAYRALARIHRHFTRLNDPRFGAIPVFELLPEQHVTIMEAVDQPSLRDLAMRHGRWRSASGLGELQVAFAHAGAWLQAYQAIPTATPLETVQTQRSEFIDFTEQLTTYLARHLGDESYFSRIESLLTAAAYAELPERLPAGLVHGDYAMRNILVGPGGRVTVLDIVGRFRMSAYRDIGAFLANLYYGCLPAFGQGAFLHVSRVAEYRRAFLGGYFGDASVPENLVRLYEVQALLEKWSSIVWRRSQQRGRAESLLTRPHVSLLSAFFRSMIERRLPRDSNGRRAASRGSERSQS